MEVMPPRKFLIPIAASVICLLLFLSFRALGPHTRPDERLGSHYVRDTHKNRVIIFVNGLYGDPNQSWTCAHSLSWQQMMLDDPTFNDSDIYVAGFTTPRVGNNMNVDEIVASMKNRFDADKVMSSHREIIFVAHSLGGIIVQRYLLTYRDVGSKTRFIYFFSTPESGSQLANLAKLYSSDPLLKALTYGNDNEYLQNLEAEWLSAPFVSIKRYCAYEKRATKGIIVVDRLSGTRNCQAALPIDRDHESIVKPCSRQDDSYLALSNAISENPPLPIEPPSHVHTSPTPVNLLANLYFQHLEPSYFSADHTPYWLVTTGEPYRINVPYAARGPGDASNVRDVGRFLLVDKVDETALKEEGMSLQSQLNQRKGGEVMNPGDSFFFTINGVALTEQNLSDMVALKKWIVLMFGLSYRDAEGSHYVHKCWILQPSQFNARLEEPIWKSCGVFVDSH
jgi:pimeloyl-ACP methyl ester carboxylesterase